MTGLASLNLANDKIGTLADPDRSRRADLAALCIACGFYMLQPNQAAAITLFGDYRGHRPRPPACAGSGRG